MSYNNYIPDNHDLWEEHDRMQTNRIEKLPVCCCCGNPIQQETAVFIHRCWFCDACMEESRVEVDI